MRRTARSRLLAGGLVLCAGLAAAPSGSGQTRASDEPILVLAASSLTDVLPQVAVLWRASGGGEVRFSFAATSRLAPLALQGDADLLVSADEEWMDWVVERGGAARGDVVALLGNSLVVAVPAAAETLPRSLAELASVPRLALAGESVPAGRYARAALEAAGVWDAVAARVVRGESVRSALEWVARGEAAAAIVYKTDVPVQPDVRAAFEIPAELTPRIVYPAAVLASAPHADRARAFVEFSRSASARELFAAAGFVPLGPGTQVAPETPSQQSGGAQPNPRLAVALSLVVALVATLLGLPPALLLGRLLARRDFRGKTLVTGLVLLPLVLPPVVTGFLLLELLGTRGVFGPALGALGITVPFTLVAPVIAAVVVGLPLYVLSARGAFEAVDPRLEEVSWTLGTRPRSTFVRIVLPLALPGITAGAVLAFARALGEFGATVVLAGNIEGRTRTIPLAVYALLESPGGGRGAWLLAVASVALALLALVGFELLSRWQRVRLEETHRP
jgi:molybdate transport system permease protein